MIYDPAKHHRRSIRLKDYDYAQAGAYFVTICTEARTCLFGDVAEDTMRLNDAGHLMEALWRDISIHFPNVDLDSFVVMPNHVHGIILLSDFSPGDGKGATTRVAPTIGQVVGAFKSLATVEYIKGVKAKRWSKFRRRLWQRDYYEHIIRDEAELARLRRYIDENPVRWALDDENPQRATP